MGRGQSGGREMLLQAARRIFAARGYHGTTVDAILQAAHLSKGAFYWHFPDKFSLYREIMQAHAEEVRCFFLPAPGEVWDSPVAFLRERGEQFLERCFADEDARRLWMHFWEEVHRGNEEFRVLARDFRESFQAFFSPLLEKAFPGLAGEEEGLTAEEFFLALDACLDGLAVGFGWHGDADLVKRLWAFLLRRICEGGESLEA